MDLWIVWLIIIIVLAVLEASTVTLVCIWFIASALVALIVSFFGIEFIWQFGVFVLLGLFLMITTKPILKKWIKPRNIKTNSDRVIGMRGVVTESILKNTIGEVKVDGKHWSAISKSECLKEEEVIVDAIDGVKLIVHKLEK